MYIAVLLGDAEVYQDGFAGRGDLDIAGLYVAVDDGRVLAVQVVERARHLVNPAQGVLFGQRAALIDHVLQIYALDKLHHQVLGVALQCEVVEHNRQVGVAQGGQQRRLALELAGVLGRFQEILFDGDVAAQPLVEGAVDRAHAALAQQGHNAVTFVDNCAGSECHTPIL